MSQSVAPLLIFAVLLCQYYRPSSGGYAGYGAQQGPNQQQYYGPRGGRQYESYGSNQQQQGQGPNQQQYESFGPSRQQYGRSAESQINAPSANSPPEPAWTPVREPKMFNAFVADKIEGSHIMRQEKWDNGTMSGSYAQPMGNGKWDIITYIADDKGYRILSKKTVDESQLPSIEAAMASKEKNANVNVDHNGAKTSYIVTPDQINKNPQPQEQEQKKNQ